MKEVKKSWMAVVMGVILVGTLVGVVWARPNDRPEAQDITRKVTLTGADFVPVDDTDDWYIDGPDVFCESGNCVFSAPVVFPCLPSVTVERIKLHVWDNNFGGNASAQLYRAHPPTATHVWLGKAESPAGIVGLQTYTSDPINKVVWPSQRAFISLWIGGQDTKVFGVTVEYHRNI